MTEKQRKILEDWLTEENIDKLNELGYKAVSSFIDLIIKTTGYDRFLRYKYTAVPYKERKPTELEKKEIEKLVNLDREKYGLISDEYASLYNVTYFPKGKEIFHLEQTWSKGMSNSNSSKSACIYRDGTKVVSVYNDLIDLGILTHHHLLQYLMYSTE